MRTLFLAVFVALFCFTSVQCAYEPDWDRCEKPDSPVFVVWNMTFDDVPTPGKNMTAKICGRGLTYFKATIKKISISSGTAFKYDFPFDQRFDWVNFVCVNVNFEIPQGSPQSPPIRFLFFTVAEGRDVQLACIDTTSELTTVGVNKFLGS